MTLDLDGPPVRVYERVVALDEDAFAAAMADPATRERVIDVLVGHMASLYRGDPTVDAVLHVKLWDRPGGGYDHRELLIRDGACVATDAPEHEPRLTLKVRPTDLRRIVNGEAGPKRLALQGRLRAIGDVGLGLRLSQLFDL